MGLFRNLTAGEIVSQVRRSSVRQARASRMSCFMGMGEPLHNYDQRVKAVGLIGGSQKGMAITRQAHHGVHGWNRADD